MKLSKQLTKRHDEALAILNLDRKLKYEEIEQVYRDYQPGATNILNKAGIFFTSPALAREFAIFANGGSNYLDACAGIGALTWALTDYTELHNGNRRWVAVEINPEFIAVGKKLLPHVEWIRGDIFDRALLESLGTFHVGIANPPFGNVPSAQCNWTDFKGPAHLRVAEILLRLCRSVEMIIPDADQEYPGAMRKDHDRGEPSGVYRRWKETHPDYTIATESIDCSSSDEYKFQHAGITPAIVSVEPRNHHIHPLFGTVGQRCPQRAAPAPLEIPSKLPACNTSEQLALI